MIPISTNTYHVHSISVYNKNGIFRLLPSSLLLNKYFLFTLFLLFIHLVTFSQDEEEVIKHKLILKGKVLVKDKPMEGFLLKLSHNDVEKYSVLTEKNGKYSLEIEISDINDTSGIYTLDILKIGFVPKKLEINSFIAKEEDTYDEYVFNIDITAIPTTIKTELLTLDHVSGKIKWNAEEGTFLIDHKYAELVYEDEEKMKNDPDKYVREQEEKKRLQNEQKLKDKEEENRKKAEAEAKREVDKLAELKKKQEQEELKKAALEEEKKKQDELKKSQLSAKKAEEEKRLNKIKADSILAKLKADSIKKEQTAHIIPRKDITIVHHEKTEIKGTMMLDTIKPVEKKVVSKKTKTIQQPIVPPPAKEDVVENKVPEDKQQLKAETIEMTSFDFSYSSEMNTAKIQLEKKKAEQEKKKGENLNTKYKTVNRLTSLLDVIDAYEKKLKKK